MASITDLSYTDNMASNKKPFLTDVRETLDSIETYINDSIKDNLVQLAVDAFPAAYAFDSDGAKNITSTLYDKQNSSDSYTGGNFSLSTTGAWTDVDATNASIAFTPDLAGDFRLVSQFNLQLVTSNATNEVDIRFRLTDSATNSTVLRRVKSVSGVSGSTLTVPVTIEHVFADLAASAQTVKVQYYLTTLTNATVTLLAGTDDPFTINVEKI